LLLNVVTQPHSFKIKNLWSCLWHIDNYWVGRKKDTGCVITSAIDG
jgi:hypothetical protein